MKYFVFVLIGVGCFFFIHLFRKYFKIPKLNALVLFTGGVKSGKTTMAVYYAIKKYKQNVRLTKFRNFFLKLFRREPDEMPLLYSNIPLAEPYVPLTNDLLRRKKRFAFGSVVYIDEASLLADRYCYDDKLLNEQLTLFAKLIGHELHSGGVLIMDTQALGDVSISFRRSLSQNFYIQHLTKIPFLPVGYATLVETIYSEDGSITSNFGQDLDEITKKVFFNTRVWKYFDSYAFSSFTDDLEVEDNVVTASSLKVADIISFNHFYTLGVRRAKKDVR